MYCNITEVKSRNTLILSDVSDSDIETQISTATSIVKGYLNTRYPLPLSSLPDIVRSITADLAAAKLLSNVIGNRGEDGEPTQAYDLRKEAMSLLRDISSGKLDLAVTEPVAQKAAVRSSTYNTTSKFGSWDPNDFTSYQT